MQHHITWITGSKLRTAQKVLLVHSFQQRHKGKTHASQTRITRSDKLYVTSWSENFSTCLFAEAQRANISSQELRKLSNTAHWSSQTHKIYNRFNKNIGFYKIIKMRMMKIPKASANQINEYIPPLMYPKGNLDIPCIGKDSFSKWVAIYQALNNGICRSN